MELPTSNQLSLAQKVDVTAMAAEAVGMSCAQYVKPKKIMLSRMPPARMVADLYSELVAR